MQIPGIGVAGPPAAAATGKSAPAPVQSLKPTAPAPDRKQLEQAVQAANRTMESAANNNSIEFSINQDSGEAIVRVVDTETGQLIRQIPSQEIIEISRALDRLQGLLLRQKA